MMTMRRGTVAALLLLEQALFGQMVFRGGQMPLTPPPSTSKPEDRCVVEGRVNNAMTGEPLKKATLRLMRQMSSTANVDKGQGAQGYTTTSLADGTFKFENVEPGDYHLSGSRSGYLSSEYGAKNVNQRGSTVTLRPAQQLADISIALTPQAVISGKVVDQDGDPVDGAMVQIVAERWERGKLRHMMQNGSNTNDLGEYRIADVHPGKYYLVVQITRFMGDKEAPEAGKPDVRPVKTFYPEAPNLQAATPLDIKAGQDLTGIDIRLRSAATYHVRGKVVGALPDGVADHLNVTAALRQDDENMMFMFGGGSNISKDRSFDISGLAPGAYTLNLFSMGGQQRVLGHQDVDVGQGDVNDVQLATVQPGTLRGQVMFEGNPQAGASAANVKNVRIFMVGAEPSRMTFVNEQPTPKDDGTFALENVPPGKYFLNTNAPSGTYLKSVRLGNQEVLGKELDLSQGSGQVTLIFSYGVAEVDGTVQLPQNAPTAADSGGSAQPAQTPGAEVVLVPDTLNEDGSGIHYGNSGAGGAFFVKQLPPGHYRAYALEQMDYGQLQNPDVLKQLESKGVEVEVRENEKKQIQLPLITTDEMQQIYARLGIEVPQ